jgi:hypothetical protein
MVLEQTGDIIQHSGQLGEVGETLFDAWHTKSSMLDWSWGPARRSSAPVGQAQRPTPANPLRAV